MIELATTAQAVAVFAACWAIISGIGAWKREFIGKRQIRDAVAFIRNPFSRSGEGTTRKKGEHETHEKAQLLDRGYIVVERYVEKEAAFAEFNTLKYMFMATFGANSEEIFTETNRVLNSIFASAKMLATHYWQRQGWVKMEGDEFQRHLDEMHRHEGIFWDTGTETDEVRTKLNAIQAKLEAAVKPCFQEPADTYTLFTKKWF